MEKPAAAPPAIATITIQLAERDGSYFRRAEILAPAPNALLPDVVVVIDEKGGDQNSESFFISASIVAGTVRVVARADRSPELVVYRRASVAWECE